MAAARVWAPSLASAPTLGQLSARFGAENGALSQAIEPPNAALASVGCSERDEAGRPVVPPTAAQGWQGRLRGGEPRKRQTQAVLSPP